jgi:thioredoxin reductase
MSVVVVGAGPAGLACAVELRRRGAPDVLVLDREPRAGGIPRHCAHQGFGLRDLHRVQSGPRYAERCVRLACEAGADVRVETMVTGWSDEGALEVTSPEGRELLDGSAIVLATGCRERPRSAQLVPGSRPDGVMTTGLLQQLAEGDAPIGTRALIVGAEHVSFSALLTLAHAGVKVAGMVTDLPRPQSFPLVHAGAALRYRVPVWTRTAVAAIHGRPRVEEVELVDLDTGRKRRVACDTVVFTGDWIPDHELAVMAGLELDPGTRGPRVDAGLRTGREGVFAAGNLLHGAEPADVAALSGRHAAAAVCEWLTEGAPWPEQRVPIICRAPLRWISPNAISHAGGVPPRRRFTLRSVAFLRRPLVEIRQDERLLWSGSVAKLVPGRSASLPAGWTTQVEPSGPQIEVAVRPRR